MPTDPDAAGPIRVFLVDDHRVVRSGISAYFAQVDDINVVGEAGDGRQALDRIAQLEPSGNLPDVVLMDLVMPVMDGIETTRRVKARRPGVEVVVMTSFIEEAQVRGALEAGAAGYLLKDADADQVAQALRTALAGQTHLDPGVAAAAGRLGPHPPPPCRQPDAEGTRGVGARGPRSIQSADRPNPGGERAHGADPRVSHPHEAGPGVPYPGRSVGRP
jgi:DNA-binding NarL/FixJ family response regulator